MRMIRACHFWFVCLAQVPPMRHAPWCDLDSVRESDLAVCRALRETYRRLFPARSPPCRQLFVYAARDWFGFSQVAFPGVLRAQLLGFAARCARADSQSCDESPRPMSTLLRLAPRPCLSCL